MADPHESPENETPVQRRQRLLNLNAAGWKPEREAPEAVEPVEEAAPEPSEPSRPSRSERS